jgi:hypothetical protein
VSLSHYAPLSRGYVVIRSLRCAVICCIRCNRRHSHTKLFTTRSPLRLRSERTLRLSSGSLEHTEYAEKNSLVNMSGSPKALAPRGIPINRERCGALDAKNKQAHSCPQELPIQLYCDPFQSSTPTLLRLIETTEGEEFTGMTKKPAYFLPEGPP